MNGFLLLLFVCAISAASSGSVDDLKDEALELEFDNAPSVIAPRVVPVSQFINVIPSEQIVVDRAVFNFVTSDGIVSWSMTKEDNNGNALQGFPVVVTGMSTKLGLKEDLTGMFLPPPNVPVSAVVIGDADGAVAIKSWRVLEVETVRRSVVASGNGDEAPVTTRTVNVNVYKVTIPDDTTNRFCGVPNRAPFGCTAFCGIGTPEQAVSKLPEFYSLASKGKLQLAFKFIDVTVPVALNPGIDNMPAAVNVALGAQIPPPANFYMYLVPGTFRMNGAGFGQLGGRVSWINYCNFHTAAHEFGHNLGFHHAGVFNPQATFRMGQTGEYLDFSSVMGTAYMQNSAIDGFVGFGAFELARRNWLESSEILTINANGIYTIPNSLSSNNGIRAAHVVGADTFWLEYRESINQDRDLKNSRPWSTKPILGSLLIKQPRGSGNGFPYSELVAVVPPGEEYTSPRGLKVQYRGVGRVVVNGFAGDVATDTEPVVPIPTTARETFTPSPITFEEETQEPMPPPPTGPKCVVSGDSGVCTKASLCPGSTSLRGGCKRGLVCCYGF